MKNKVFVLLVFMFDSLLAQSHYVLDSTFGVNGFAKNTSFSNFHYAPTIQDMAFTKEKKIFLGGHWDHAALLLRLNEYGYLDSTFGVNGIMKDTTTYNQFISSVAPLGETAVLVGGSRQNDMFTWDDAYIAKRKQDGSLDTDFGTNGDGYVSVLPNTPINKWVSKILVRPTGEIIVAGQYPPIYLFVAQYFKDGIPDPSFGNGGLTVVYDTTSVVDMLLLSDGKVITLDGNLRYLHKFNVDGSIDTSFSKDNSAMWRSNFPTYRGQSFAEDVDGRLIVSGVTTTTMAGQSYHTLIAYQANGKVDSTFGINGVARNIFNTSYIRPVDIKIHKNKIVTNGFAQINGMYSSQFVARFFLNGNADISFTSDSDTCITDVVLGGFMGYSYIDSITDAIYIGGITDTVVPTIVKYIPSVVPTAVEENIDNPATVIYPNPIEGDIVYIEGDFQFSKDGNVYLSDMYGNVIHGVSFEDDGSNNLNRKRVVLPPNLSNGIYILHTNSVSKTHHTWKFCKY